MKTPHTNIKFTTRKDHSNQPPAWFPSYHKPPKWSKFGLSQKAAVQQENP